MFISTIGLIETIPISGSAVVHFDLLPAQVIRYWLNDIYLSISSVSLRCYEFYLQT